MKIGPLRVLGVWVLLAAMVFALVKIDTADVWAAWWIPCVLVGLALVFVDAFIDRRRKRNSS